MNEFESRIEKAAEADDRPAAAFLPPGNRWNGLIGAIGTYITVVNWSAYRRKISRRGCG